MRAIQSRIRLLFFAADMETTTAMAAGDVSVGVAKLFEFSESLKV
ncbi:hypothetical protein [Hoeflea prorocentri]|uniref:Uncharacterized protein n=1 Tax=Hoeflea prorocentri TaxID=1922333 RepID=A0A9X3ZG04_9HYPH|nr:hypothetical protein [Hoeflea prorocentri]MCY6379320.1 hypothetical protein [Hoeflea prorocentri]MDA5397121.1 hypothetical protein [Hoeflea prorocentri]